MSQVSCGNLLLLDPVVDGRVELVKATAQGRVGEVVMAVKDNGIGIAPQLLPRLFDLFTQAERSLDRSQGGLGIGLALVKSLVGMHGGQVTVSSEGPGRGSEFVVRLPVPRDATGPADAAAQPQGRQ